VALSSATVHVCAEELEADGDADVRVKVAVVSDDRCRLDLDVMTSRSHAMEVLAISVDAALVRALVGGAIPHKAVSDRRRRTFHDSSSADLFLAEVKVVGVLGWPASPLPRRTNTASTCARRLPSAVIV